MAGSGQLGFKEFVTLATKFIVEEDADALQKELKEAFRLYDKEGISVVLAGAFVCKPAEALGRV